jgi:septal ring factor EnvC (AmiA/AmiB activator)
VETAKVAVAIAILSLIVTASASVYLYSSNQTALAQQKSAYDTQISALQGQISTLQTQLASAEQQESADSSAISSLQSSVTSIQTQLPTISQVPQTTLVITNDVYNTEMLPSPSQSRIRRTIPSMPNLVPLWETTVPHVLALTCTSTLHRFTTLHRGRPFPFH